MASVKNPPVCSDVQPFSWAFTIPYTSASKPAVTVTAPATSKLLCACSSFDSGTKRSDRTNTAIPTGTLTKKIHGHDSVVVSTPPRTRPTAPPPTAIAAQTPIAFVRSAPSANVVVMIESAAGAMSAAPRPWTPRKTMRNSELGASPLSSDATVKTTMPTRNTFLRPARSPARPPRSRKPPNISVYAFTIHWRSASRHIEVGLDGGQRDVHDRRVEDDHELRHAHEHEDEPRVDPVVPRGGAGDGELAHDRAP